MMKGKVDFTSRATIALLAFALGLLAFGCGGGGPGPDPGNTKDIYVKRFSAPNFSGILLDESVSWVFSHPVDEATLNHDSIRIRTGAQGGEAPRGTFVRGIFLIDPNSDFQNLRVVVDPDQLDPATIASIENNEWPTTAAGPLSWSERLNAAGFYFGSPLPTLTQEEMNRFARYDSGADSPTSPPMLQIPDTSFEGRRQVLFNRTFKHVVTFIPEIPSRLDLSDTGYAVATTYTVVLPTFPSLNIVHSIDGYPLLPRDGRVFVSTFTTVPLGAPGVGGEFLGGENVGNPRVVNTQPKNGFRVNVVRGMPEVASRAPITSTFSLSSNRLISAEFEVIGVDDLENVISDTVTFTNESGAKATTKKFARVQEVFLRSGSVPDAFIDTVTPSNSKPRGMVQVSNTTTGLLGLLISGPVSGPEVYALDYSIQVEDTSAQAPAYVAEVNPEWASPVLGLDFNRPAEFLLTSPVGIATSATFTVTGTRRDESTGAITPLVSTATFTNDVNGALRSTSGEFAAVTQIDLTAGSVPAGATIVARWGRDGHELFTVTGPTSAPTAWPVTFDNSDGKDGNGNDLMSVVGVDMRISIRFSQPIDPRTVTAENFFLTVATAGGVQQVPVSLFLRQTRLGVVEVVMTPLTEKGLPVDQVYEVSVSSSVVDLLQSPVSTDPKSFEISTGGPPPTVGDIVESFDNSAKEDQANTTANWGGGNNKEGFVGYVPGALTAVFAPYAGDGHDGDYAPTADQINFLDTDKPQTDPDDPGGFRQYEYESVSVGFGVAVVGQGNHGLVIRSQGKVDIIGLLDCAGKAGGDGGTGELGDTVLNGGAAGGAGPGGFRGGGGAMSSTNLFDGEDGFGPAGSGGGIGGLTGDQNVGTGSTDQLRFRVAGGGGGHATAGTRSDSANSKGQGSGEAGPAYGKADFSDAVLVPLVVGVPTLDIGFGGAGGGGGGGEDDGTQDLDGDNVIDADGIAGPEDEGGGGGGGGGGSVQIVSYTNITISGQIDASGGDGGTTNNPSTGSLGQGAGGGGGAGGSIWIQARGEITLDSQAGIEATGGLGAQGDWNGVTVQKGGNGGDGYIRFEDKDGKITISDGSSNLPNTVTPTTTDSTATFSPALDLNSTAISQFYNQRIVTPNYGAALIDQDLNDGTITVFVQGAREDLGQSGPQPVDPDNDPLRLFTTDWVPIAQIDQLDNYQYLRFRVEFTVDPLHTFTTPLPVIREIRIPVSTSQD